MDERTRAEVIKALRSAVRCLRAVEQAIVQVPSSAPVAPAVPSAPQPTAPAVDPAEAALFDFISTAASNLKMAEEQDPAVFAQKAQAQQDDLLRFILVKQMFQSGPKGAGAIGLDPTEATRVYEQALKAMTENGINQTEVMTPFIHNLLPKHWGDVDPDKDLVVFRYETPGPVTGHLDMAALKPLVEAARKAPGSLDRVSKRLAAECAVAWEPVEGKTSQINCAVVLSNVEAKWCACVDASAVVEAVVARLAVVEVDPGNTQEGWWDAARLDTSIPQAVLPVIRGQQPKVLCLKSDIDKIEDWAASLAGWYDGSELNPIPLIVRDAASSDILSGGTK